MGDINRLNKYNTRMGGSSVNRAAPSSAQRSPSKSGSMMSGFMGAARRFLSGGKK